MHLGHTPLSISCRPFKEPFWMINSSLVFASFATESCDRSYIERMSSRLRSVEVERAVHMQNAQGRRRRQSR